MQLKIDSGVWEQKTFDTQAYFMDTLGIQQQIGM